MQIGWDDAELVFWIYIPALVWSDASPAMTSCKHVQIGPINGNNLPGQRPCDQSNKHNFINKVPTSQYLPRGVSPLCWSLVISQTPPNSFPSTAFVIQPHIYSDRSPVVSTCSPLVVGQGFEPSAASAMVVTKNKTGQRWYH